MKKTMPKIAFSILLIVFVLSTCMVVFATTSKSVTEKQNGVEATLNFNKQEYKKNEKVEITLKVKNNNSYDPPKRKMLSYKNERNNSIF